MASNQDGQHTILASWVGALATAVQREGHNWDELCRIEKVIDPRLSASGARLQHDIMRDIWTRASTLTNDPAISLRAAKCLKPHALHSLGYGMMAASSLDEVCRLVQRHFHVISTAAALDIEVGSKYYTLTSVCEPAVNDEGFEMFMAFIAGVFDLISNDEIKPVKVSLRRSVTSKAARDRYSYCFQADTEFEAPQNMIVFEKAQLMQPLPTANPEIRLISERMIAQYLEDFGSGEFRTIVRSRILSLLRNGRASEEAVAKGLNMSCSSLSRRLRLEGVTYRHMLNETQKSLALQHLQDVALPISEIGFRLGFEDLSSFSRSFRRWTGVSPREWRRRHCGPEAFAEEKTSTDKSEELDCVA
jgi:AraC-like DNA-binding protein